MPRLDMLRICGRRRLLLTRLGTGSHRSLPTNKALFSSSPVPAPAPASSAPSPTPAAATADSQAAKPQNSPGAKRGVRDAHFWEPYLLQPLMPEVLA